MRKPIIAGNWKMYKTVSEAEELVKAVVAKLGDYDEVEVVFCPPFTALAAVKQLIKGTRFGLGAQNLYWKNEGAYTGEISPLMLKEIGCDYCVIGHSERRQYFGETDADVNQKVKAALDAGIKPIICVGESLEQRESGQTESLVRMQTEKALEDVEPSLVPQIVIAYEPIWAIGTGKSSDGPDANRVIGWIRDTVRARYGHETAQAMRIQYGGSVKPDNIKEFMDQPEIDGALVGGASLDPESFVKIVRYNQ
ncbi:MAG TPA: triose-phosphate isomerase [Bacillota bacterium]|nr:triose-phosphate isomerase [Bacillota bacterium]